MPAFALDSTLPLPAQPLKDYTWLQRSSFFVHLAQVAYEPLPQVAEALAPLTEQVAFWDRDGAQAYWIETPSDCVVAFRGTEPDDWNDWKADLDADRIVFAGRGRVHHGFWQQLEDLWPLLEERFRGLDRPLWITGHSLGGALAVVAAARCGDHAGTIHLRGIYTFGAPRAGDRAFVRSIDLPHYRWVHNNDLVPQLPPVWMGFAHHGRQVYLGRHGRLRQWAGWERWLDRLHGWLAALWNMEFDGIGDHSIAKYARSLDRVVARYAPLTRVPMRLGAPRRRTIQQVPLRRAA